MLPLISIVITTYNRDRYLATAIESVLGQTYENLELLIWDDGSSDRSVEIAQSYAAKDPRVRLIAAPHQGRVAALQAAITATRGLYLGWVDSDDWLAPTALSETATVLLAQPQVGMVYTDYWDVNDEGELLRYGHRCRTPYSKDRLLLTFMTFHFRLLRRSVFDQVDGLNGSLDFVEDYDLCLRLSEVTQVRRVNRPLYYYRVHAESASQQWALEQILRSHTVMVRALKRRGLADRFSLEVQLPQGIFSLRRKRDQGAIVRASAWVSLSLLGALPLAPARAESITPASNGTGTIVSPLGDRFDITGGTPAGNNLFHSFQQFGLTAGQTANFIANPQVQNILGRVVGSNPSMIHGLIQVTGSNANLFLLNPAGIVFGANASLNVSGSFTATTATAIGIGNDWFSAIGANNYANLTGNPSSFAFATSQPGAIVNAGNLAVSTGQTLALLGGTVINTGQLTAPDGQVVIAAVPGQNLVRLSQTGSLLNLEFQPLNAPAALVPPSLPQLLTGGNLESATGITVNADGSLRLTSSNQTLPTSPGTAIVAGTVTTSGQTGGAVTVVGTQVGLVGATIAASGVTAGGIVRIGGDYQGNGTLPNATQTVVTPDSKISADALQQGDGGRIIIWADQTTSFWGDITARGGAIAGNGGFVEVSGKQNLQFRGNVNTAAPNGSDGTLLLDPADIVIRAGGPTAGFSGTVLFADPAPTDIFQNQLASLPGNTNVLIQATNSITFDSTFDLTFLTGNGTITFEAGGVINTNGSSITASGRNVTLSGGSLILGEINTSSAPTGGNAQGGNITLTSSNGSITAGTLDSSANGPFFGSGTAGSVTVTSAQDITLFAVNAQGNGYGFGYNGVGNNVSLTTTGYGAIRLQGSITDSEGQTASISTVGSVDFAGGTTPINGTITITHGGGVNNVPFSVGNPAVNGSAGVLNAGAGSSVDTGTAFPVAPAGDSVTPIPRITINSINTAPSLSANSPLSGASQNQPFTISYSDLAVLLNDPDQDNVSLLITTIAPGASLTLKGSPVVPGSTLLQPGDVLQYTPPIDATGVLNAFTIQANDVVATSTPKQIQVNVTLPSVPTDPTDPTDPDPGDPTPICPELAGCKPPTPPCLGPLCDPPRPESGIPGAVSLITPATPESSFTSEFASYLGLQTPTVVSLDDQRQIARDIEQATGAKPAFIYVSFVPADWAGGEPVNLTGFPLQENPTDQLELLVVTAQGNALRQRLPQATREQVMTLARQFRLEVSDPRKTRSQSYLAPSQQLYQWLIAPISANLQTQGINNLVFLMDTGLRSLPVAALHDGQQFIIAKYSVGVMPSLSLTDTRYRDIRGAQVLGMGISESTQDQPPLPAVPIEVSTIVNRLWSGRQAFNENVTLNNLRQLRQQQPFGIIHLATHADFSAGEISNSYIQLWNEKLRLSEIRQLGWNNPQVDLLVLSACATALGNRDAELGFGGLAVQTGVKTALASLWYVSDAGTTALMTEFYRYLRTANIKAEALRQAQMAMAAGQVTVEDGRLLEIGNQNGILLPPANLISRDKVLSHPYYWASFTMIGNPW